MMIVSHDSLMNCECLEIQTLNHMWPQQTSNVEDLAITLLIVVETIFNLNAYGGPVSASVNLSIIWTKIVLRQW